MAQNPKSYIVLRRKDIFFSTTTKTNAIMDEMTKIASFIPVPLVINYIGWIMDRYTIVSAQKYQPSI